MFDSPDGAHLSHMVRRSAHVWLQRTEDKMDEALEIQSADGTKTLVRFGKQELGRAWSAFLARVTMRTVLIE